MNIPEQHSKAVPMPNPVDYEEISVAEQLLYWEMFLACEHVWKVEPEDSVFYKRCDKCGGAEGIKFPDII